MKNKKLRTEERDFFNLLAEVIFSNPFSFDKAQLDKTLGRNTTQESNKHHYIALVPVVEEKLQQLELAGISQTTDLSGKDRELLEYAYLFQLYHQYVDEFDQHIQEQSVQGEKPVKLKLANALIRKMQQRGFSDADIARYIALFYQIRRAYYFIDESLVGDAACMQNLRHALWNNVFTTDMRIYANHLWNRMEDFSTLILGETGSGKGSAAAAIGRSGLIPFEMDKACFSYSFTQTFVAINLSEFSENLIESELFGHRKGAFTGAIDQYKGLFERCNAHGALFLDEIGDVSIPTQIKLLNVLQERTFSPVGSHEVKRFHGRVIAATNRCLDQQRQKGEFRDDFYYRLSSDVIEMPSLYQRLQESDNELKKLVSLLIKRLTNEVPSEMLEQVMSVLNRDIPADYPWPGNVRELEQAVRRILLSGHYKPMTSHHEKEPGWFEQAVNGKLTAQNLMGAYCQMLYKKCKTYEEVAHITDLDRRTAKKYIQMDLP